MNRLKLVILGVVFMVIVGLVWSMARNRAEAKDDEKEVMLVDGSIENTVSATGNVQPQNRLEIKPPMGGRIDKVLVVEGQVVKTGDTLAIMSSTERAALLDAARLLGEGSIQNWEDVYKPTPLMAPIDGQVIVQPVNPGQTIAPGDVVVVISDRLIVQAEVDETDVGKVKLGQTTVITLDAYPDISVKGKVDHIYYESKMLNNVIIYPVDVVPDQVPDVFRSGMSANVQIVHEKKDHVLLLPKEAVKKHGDKSYVMLRVKGEKKLIKQDVVVGISDDTNVEIVSGLNLTDKVVIVTKKYLAPKSNAKSSASPFMPSGGGGRGGR